MNDKYIMDALIQALGIFLSDFPYFVLAMTLMWEHLRHSRRQAYFVMFGMTALHAVSILTITSIFPQATVDIIRIPHEIIFMAIYLAGFIWVVRIKLTRVLFMAFFIKYFAELVTSTAAYFEKSFFTDTHVSYGLYFNLCHLALLLVTFPVMYLFITRVLRKIFMVESGVWRFLWLAPAAFYTLNMMYSKLNKSIIYQGDYVVNGAVLFGISLLVYALILETLRITQEKLSKEESERRLAADNAALDRLNRMKDDLIATVTHETMTPLAVLSVYSELISRELRKKGVDEQTAKDLDVISDETQRIKWLIDELKNHTREKEDNLLKTRLNLTELTKNAARLYAPILERKNNTLILRFPYDLPDVYACANEVTQMLFNLLQNSNNHTENGEVVITAEANGDYVCVTVSDVGTGIPAELLPLVFERGVSGSENGTGLGLFLCREIIETHGGSINIDSTPGEGTRVWFTLPVWKEGTRK